MFPIGQGQTPSPLYNALATDGSERLITTILYREPLRGLLFTEVIEGKGSRRLLQHARSA